MLRVMMLSTDLQRGGLPLRLTRLARRLRASGVEPVVGCLTSPGPLSAELDADGIETFSCDASGRLDAGCLWRLSRQVRRYQPDVVHASLFHANVAARLVGRCDRMRPIITSTVTIEIERAWHRWGEAATCGASDLHVANSRAVATHLREDLCFPSDRLVVIPNAIEFEELDRVQSIERERYGIAPDAWLIVWAGRMDPVKNLPVWLEVVKRTARQGKVCAVLLGDGPERAKLEAMSHRDGLGDAVRFVGWTDATAAWMKAADCLLFPSLTEGCPNVVLEAMACGCPVIASDIPACRELIEDGVSGLLCRPNDISAFQAALDTLRAGGDKGRQMGAAACERVRSGHRMDWIVDLWRDVYERIVG